MNKRAFLGSVLLCLCLWATHARSQAYDPDDEPDTTRTYPPATLAVQLYHKNLNDASRLYNGTEYLPFAFSARGHAYFEFDSYETADIAYDGMLFRRVPLMFDIWQDLVITGHFEESGAPVKIQLISERIDSFMIAGHSFVRLVADTASAYTVPTGFYHWLYGHGDIRVYARRQKTKEERIENAQTRIEFVPHSRYYIRKGDNYYPVKSKASVMRVFSDRKKELRKFSREAGISFHYAREVAITRLAEHYDKLTTTL